MDQEKRPIQRRDFSTLSAHKRSKKILVPPLMQLPAPISLHSWQNEGMPEALWAILLAGSLPREEYMHWFCTVAKAGMRFRENAKAFPSHTALGGLSRAEFDSIFAEPLADQNVCSALTPLLLLKKLPDRAYWEAHLARGELTAGWNSLASAVAISLDHHSRPAVDVRWLRLMFLGLQHQISFGKEHEEIVDALCAYPEGENVPDWADATISAIEPITRLPEEDGGSTWCIDFWQECLQSSDCIPARWMLPSRESEFDYEPAKERWGKIYAALVRHFSLTLQTTDVDARHDAVFGLALYGMSLVTGLMRPFSTRPSGRHLLRSLAETHITLAYLLANDEPILWKTYRAYGVGQAKLAFLKLAEKDHERLPKHVDLQELERLANEDMWQEFSSINVGHWTNLDVRKMADKANVKDIYDKYFVWPSGFVHGHWSAVRDSVFDVCANPLHRFHRIPRPTRLDMEDVCFDAIDIINRSLQLVDRAYPTFELRFDDERSEGSYQNIFATVLGRVHAAVDALAAAGAIPRVDAARVVVEPPRDATHGDMATNAAMVLAKEASKKPRELAELIAEKLRADDLIAKVDVAGPGFINLALKPSAWTANLRSAVKARADFGRGAANRHKVNVEYVSANPTGPMHVGHCRGAVFGDALANLLEFAGNDVTREYYINDAGAQVDVLARSAFLRYREALGEDIGPIPEGLYPGDYLKPVGEALAAEHGRALNQMPEEKWLPIVRAKAIAMMMDSIREDLAALNVSHAVFFSERSLVEGKDEVRATIDWLRERGHVYEGRLPPPKGAPVEDYEDREQTLFRATAFGDDVDRPLMKSDGSYTYFASDIAYHKSKFDRGFADMIDVWGADHGGYIKRVQAAIKAVTDGKGVLDVKIVQLVRLLRAGELVRMSKRSGDFVTLREVVDEVGKDAVRFMMLYRKNDAVLDFDLAKVIEQSRDNPVFYVQYGHARAHSIFRNARDGQGGGPAVIPDLPVDDAARARYLADAPLERLDDASELALMKKIAEYPRLIEAAAAAHEPHRIAFYLYELASEFHTHWTRGGKESPHLRFIIQSDPRLTLARLALVQGVVTVLASGLALLGVGAPEEMR